MRGQGRADYEKKDGTALSIDFDLTYFVQAFADGARIFGFVAGDERAVYREHGIID